MAGTVGTPPVATHPTAAPSKPAVGGATDTELARHMEKLRNAVETKYNQLRKAFRDSDEDKDNLISKAELERTVHNFNLNIPVPHIHEIFDRILDFDGNGNVTFDEFVQQLKWKAGGHMAAPRRSSAAAPTAMPEGWNAVNHRAAVSITPRMTPPGVLGSGGYGTHAHTLGCPADMPAMYYSVDDMPRLLESSESSESSSSYGAFHKKIALSRGEHTSAQDALNSRFSDMHKAFQYVDLDNSGTIDRSELERALRLWGVNLSKEKIDALWDICDTTRDGEINYAEFVHVFARDTTGTNTLVKQAKTPKLTRQQTMEKAAQDSAMQSFNQRFTKVRGGASPAIFRRDDPHIRSPRAIECDLADARRLQVGRCRQLGHNKLRRARPRARPARRTDDRREAQLAVGELRHQRQWRDLVCRVRQCVRARYLRDHARADGRRSSANAARAEACQGPPDGRGQA